MPAMKITRLTLSALFALMSVAGAGAAESKAPSRVEVIFDHPEKFADAADGQRGSEFGRDSNLELLRKHLQERATGYLAEDQRLTVTVTDVDLAGEVEPWRTPQFSDVRIVKDIYAPRIALAFRLTDGTGAVVKEGTRNLSDLSFMMNVHGADRSDSRIYEKDLLDTWLRREFGSKKKKK